MSFVKLSIFGTSFEVFPSHLPSTTTHISKGHYSLCRPSTSGHGSVVSLNLNFIFYPDIPQVHSVSSGECSLVSMNAQIYISNSSAKDQLTGSSVAIKKIMKPFSTPVLSKRTYRELKLLKHIQHENVGRLYTIHTILLDTAVFRSSALAMSLSHLWRICELCFRSNCCKASLTHRIVISLLNF